MKLKIKGKCRKKKFVLIEKGEHACAELSGKSSKFWEKLENAEDRVRFLLAKRHRIKSKMDYTEDMTDLYVDDLSFFRGEDDMNYGILMLKLEQQLQNVS